MAGIYYRRPERANMKKHWLLVSVFAAGLTLGNLLPAHWLATPVDAAPADVKGSPNVAVDTYKNVDDTFVLWSDGSISAASSGTRVNLAEDYSAPPPTANIKSTAGVAKRVNGSPNVAVKAIPRGDMTLILFADGTLKRPTKGGAGEGASAPVQLYTGSERIYQTSTPLQPDRVYADKENYLLETSGGRWKLTLKHNVKRGTTAMADYNVLAHGNVYTTVPLRGNSYDGGKTWTFDIAGDYPGYNPANSVPNFFNWTILGD